MQSQSQERLEIAAGREDGRTQDMQPQSQRNMQSQSHRKLESAAGRDDGRT